MNVPEKLREKLNKLLHDDKKTVNLLIALGLAGMAMLALSEWIPQKSETSPAPAAAGSAQTVGGDAYAAALESDLTTLLGRVEGIGRVEVMVTLASGEETVYAQDTQQSADGSGSKQHVLLDGGAAEPALVETVGSPTVQGVAVVCEGGGSAGVAARVTDIVEVLTGIGASHISVTKMSQLNE